MLLLLPTMMMMMMMKMIVKMVDYFHSSQLLSTRCSLAHTRFHFIQLNFNSIILAFVLLFYV